MKVLIVEDDEKVARFIARVLGEEGFITDLCVSGADAVRQANAVAYDVVLLDLMLPGDDGLTLLKRLRTEYTIPVIMLTARSNPYDRVLGLEMGADDYMSKPFEPRELVARIQSVLRRSLTL